MPFIPVNLNDAQEAKAVPAGRYDVTISSAEEKVSAKDKPMIRAVLEIEGDHNAPPVFHYIMLPLPDQNKEELDRNMIGLRRFMKAFKIPVNPAGIDTDLLVMEMPGHSANLELKTEEYEGTVSNKLVIPRIKDDDTGTAGRGSPPKGKKS